MKWTLGYGSGSTDQLMNKRYTPTPITAKQFADWINESAKVREDSWIDKGPHNGNYALTLRQAIEQVVPVPWTELVVTLLTVTWTEALDWAQENSN